MLGGAMPSNSRTLSIDVGGTGIKMLVLAPDGSRATERTRKPTPQPATPDAVLATIVELSESQAPFDRVAVGFPGVVREGVICTAPNLGTEMWAGHDLAKTLGTALGRPLRVINDADLQGFGVISGKGAEMVLTLGTGLGAALFSDGVLYPNLELGHHPFKKGCTYEERISDAELERIGKKRWSQRVVEMLEQLQPIFNPVQLHLGGGNARKIRAALPDNVRIFENSQGLMGGLRLWQRVDAP
jgi:polyphosphate glucokinase